MLEVVSSHPPEMTRLIQAITVTTSIMKQLKEQLPQLRGENPVEVSFIREETYTHSPPVRMGKKPVTRQQSRHEAPTPMAAAPVPP
ncbi:hypothetical protein LIER_05757 [Lithospermum erythrorhizon]|uniref:Uncharacterized protein n=1 Tax=Lithospermum erythrorhizon TaxID=34254 RepID=A0AAV3P298_LITER